MNRPPKKSKAERALAAACGGQRIAVMRNDGREENVFVRQLHLDLCDRYIALCLDGDEQGRIQLCIGESAEWDKKYHNKRTSNRFTVESQVKLVTLADELNFHTALSQIERKKNTIGGLEPLMKRLYAMQASMMEDAFKKMVDSATSSFMALLSSAEARLKSGTAGATISSPSPSNAPTNEPTPPPASPPSDTSTPPSTP